MREMQNAKSVYSFPSKSFARNANCELEVRKLDNLIRTGQKKLDISVVGKKVVVKFVTWKKLCEMRNANREMAISICQGKWFARNAKCEDGKGLS